jgi:hypothetical protein
MFFRGSRYEGISETSLVAKDGRTIRYKRMRFVPQNTAPPRIFVRADPGDRPDLLAFRTIGDPEQFWRLCDLNLVRRPIDLVPPPPGAGAIASRRVAVPSPAGGG